MGFRAVFFSLRPDSSLLAETNPRVRFSRRDATPPAANSTAAEDVGAHTRAPPVVAAKDDAAAAAADSTIADVGAAYASADRSRAPAATAPAATAAAAPPRRRAARWRWRQWRRRLLGQESDFSESELRFVIVEFPANRWHSFLNAHPKAGNSAVRQIVHCKLQCVTRSARTQHYRIIFESGSACLLGVGREQKPRESCPLIVRAPQLSFSMRMLGIPTVVTVDSFQHRY